MLAPLSFPGEVPRPIPDPLVGLVLAMPIDPGEVDRDVGVEWGMSEGEGMAVPTVCAGATPALDRA